MIHNLPTTLTKIDTDTALCSVYTCSNKTP